VCGFPQRGERGRKTTYAVWSKAKSYLREARGGLDINKQGWEEDVKERMSSGGRMFILQCVKVKKSM